MFLWSSDISALLVSQPPSRAAVHVNGDLTEAEAAQEAPQGTTQPAVVVAAVMGCVVAALAVVLVMIFRRTRTRQQESDQAVIIRDTPGFMEASCNLCCSIGGRFLCSFDTLSFVGLQVYPAKELPSAVSTQ